MENYLYYGLVYWGVGCICLVICLLSYFTMVGIIKTKYDSLRVFVVFPKLYKYLIVSLVPFITIFIILFNLFMIVYLMKLKQTDDELYSDALDVIYNFIEDKTDFATYVNNFSKITNRYKLLKT